MELLNYVMTGTCTINSTNIVGLACAAEHYEIEELRQACHHQIPKCLSVPTVCEILGQLEKHLAFSIAKTMIVQCLEFVDGHASELLSSDQILSLSENMVHLVLRRDTDVPEIVKVKAAFAWGEVNVKPEGRWGGLRTWWWVYAQLFQHRHSSLSLARPFPLHPNKVTLIEAP